MGKALNALIVVWAVESCLYYFAGQGSLTSLSTLMKNPQLWDTLPIFTSFNAVLAVVGTIGLVAGLYFIRNEWIIYAGLSAVTLTFGATLYQLWQLIRGANMFGDASGLFATLVTGPLVLYYVWNMLEFARGRDQ